MDLSFRFDTEMLDRHVAVTAIPAELAILMVGVAARQAASPTARLQSDIDRAGPRTSLFAPSHGAFNLRVAATLTGWKGG